MLFTGNWTWLLWRDRTGGSDKVLQSEWWMGWVDEDETVFDGGGGGGGHLANGETEVLKKVY